IHFIFNHKFKSGMMKFAITMVATVVFDLTQAIIIGVAFSVILILIKLTDIDITVAEIEKERLEEVGVHLPKISGKVRVAYLTGAIFFAVIDKLENELYAFEGKTEGLILSMRGVPVIDLSGIQALIELVEEMEANGTEIYLTSVQPKVLEEMRRGGLIELIGEEYVFDSAEEAIVVAQQEHM
ncbi:MAG: SulP family inorganic anion transporter, partial [Firmicutes bacterium]|nr:SulP family inorganic anion transporter [Bacillota bacterium]